MAVKFIRKFAKWFFLSLNILVVVAFLPVCLSPFINPVVWPPIGFLSIALPYTAIVLFLFIIFWLIVKPRLAILSAATLLLGWQQLSVIVAWHSSPSFVNNKADSTIRIVTWNVRGMYGISNSSYTQQRNRKEIVALINKLNPDVLCMQEFNNNTIKNDPSANNIDLFLNNYPNYFFSRDIRNRPGTYFAGSVLFTKYPIIDSGQIKYQGPQAESLIYIDILKGKDTIRIYTTHLQSYEFSQEDYSDIAKIKDPDPDTETLEASENLYSKMKTAILLRGRQADVVRTEINKSPYPSVICGDFNDVPNSYTYFHIRGDRQDAFLQAYSGIGRSFNAIAPTLRIDYILPDKDFKVVQFDMVDEGLSDHHLLVSDLSLKK